MMWSKLKKHISGILTLIFIFSIIGTASWMSYDSHVKWEEQIVQILEREREVTCPALLSIARTPRDTLIVMKNKPVCVEYVLENLR